MDKLLLLVPVAGVALAVLLFAGFTALGAAFLMLAWNVVGPPLFGGPEITFLQALGISFLLSIVGSIFRGHRS